MSTVRAFICIELPDVLRDELARLQKLLKPASRGVRWVRPQGIHLTLKFLGDVKTDQLPAIESAVENATADVLPFELKADGAGAFPNYKRPRVYWIGINDPTDTLATLQQQIEAAIEPLGFPREKRSFSPHLTLGRVKSPDNLPAIQDILEAASLNAEPFTVRQIILMKSELQPGGAVYTPLHTFEL